MSIKAVLLSVGVEIHFTHDLTLLLEALAQPTASAPASVARSDWLTPSAVAARYGREVPPLDRDKAVEVASDVFTWASELLSTT